MLELQERLEREIRRLTCDQRGYHVTRWNRYFTKEIRELMNRWVGRWVSGWVGRWVDGWVSGWVGEWVGG